MTPNVLTDLLARRVLGWNLGPDRYLIGRRQWLPKWRFQPLVNLQDAFRLLQHAAPDEYILGSEEGGFWARVRIAGISGEAHESSQARAITFAVAHALKIAIPGDVGTAGLIPQHGGKTARGKRNG